MVWPYQGSNPRCTTLGARKLTITPPMRFWRLNPKVFEIYLNHTFDTLLLYSIFQTFLCSFLQWTFISEWKNNLLHRDIIINNNDINFSSVWILSPDILSIPKMLKCFITCSYWQIWFPQYSNKNIDIRFSAHNAFHQVCSKSKDWKAK